MGLFDKVRDLKNAVTGGAADVSVHVKEARRGEPFVVLVRAETGESPVDMDGAYIKIRGIEEIEVPDMEIEVDGEVHTESVERETVTFETEMKVADAQELEPEQTYEWEVEVTLPEDVPPAYEGKFAEHEYEILAGLDCFGNDPDSGWHEFDVH